MSQKKEHAGGPKTPEGKLRASLNSIRHGLTAKAVVLSTEDPARFHELLNDYLDRYQPADKLELDLVHELAACRWRLQRAWCIETAAFEISMERHQHMVNSEFPECEGNRRMTLAWMDLADESRSMMLLHRYETRLTRRFHQIIAELKTSQNQRERENCKTNSAPAADRPAKLTVVPKPSPKLDAEPQN